MVPGDDLLAVVSGGQVVDGPGGDGRDGEGVVGVGDGSGQGGGEEWKDE